MTKAQKQMIKEYTEKKFQTLKFRKELKLSVDISGTSSASVMFFLDERTDNPIYVYGWKQACKPAHIKGGRRIPDERLKMYCDMFLSQIKKMFGE